MVNRRCGQKSGHGPQPLRFRPVTRDACERTVNVADSMNNDSDRQAGRVPSRWQTVAEIVLIVGLLFLYTGGPPPDVNEAHYLVKAKNYWNPEWCGTDIFLQSADAHASFYWTFGWWTLWCSLPTVAWLGRLVAWTCFAVAWRGLSGLIFPERFGSVLTAALFILLSDRCHLSGEWAVGGFEAKGIAYALVLWGLRYLVLGRWNRVWPLLGAAAAFHVLVGGWSVVAAAIAWSLSGPQRTPLTRMGMSLGVGFLLSLPGLVPALLLTAEADPATIQQANAIYVFHRLSHHLVWYRFEVVRWFAFGGLLTAWGVLTVLLRECHPWSQLHRFAVGSLAIAGLGVVIGLVLLPWPQWSAALLKFYWFRLADVAIPISVSLGLPLIVVSGGRTGQWRWDVRRMGTWLGLALIVVPAAWFVWRWVELQRDFRPRAVVQSQGVAGGRYARAGRQYAAWRSVCEWIARHSDPQDRFLTPRGQQTFKWYAGRAEVACWKDVPQDPASVVRWWRLMNSIYSPEVIESGLGAWSETQLQELAREHRFQYILVDRRRTGRRLGFQRVYPEAPEVNAFYELYRVEPGVPWGPDWGEDSTQAQRGTRADDGSVGRRVAGPAASSPE